MSSPVVIVKQIDAVLHVQINRPATKNALNVASYQALHEALEAAKEDASVKVVVLSGAEGNFSSGNDLADFASQPPSGEEAPVLKFMRSLFRFDKPVIAAVNGVAVGIGSTMLMHCDMVYADDTAKFMLPFNNLGLSVEFGASFVLPRLMGRAKAMEVILMGEPFGAEQAEDYGLVTSVHDDVVAHALSRAQKLAKQPAQATRINKALLRAESQELLEQLIVDELKVFGDTLRGPEFQEAVTAFMEKRAPSFA